MKNILIIDIETTGFLNGGGKIIEIGAVSLDLDTGERFIMIDELCRDKDLTLEDVEKSWIVKNSDIDAKAVMESRLLEDIKPLIQAVIDDFPLGATAYNNTFDFGFMESVGFKFPVKLACPMKLSTNICKIQKKGRGFGYKWPKVQEAYDFFFGKTDYVEKHRGADDAKHEAKIVYELYKRGIFKLNNE